MSPDLAARKVIVAAYLYYRLDSPTMDDSEYDKLSVFVSENWDDLHPDRKWCCGSAADIRAGGSHIKFTTVAVCAAGFLYEKVFSKPVPSVPDRWHFDPEHGHYVTATL